MTDFKDVPQEVLDAVDEVLSVTGRKHDAGKLRWHLMPWRQVAEVAEVLEHGAKKYGEFNWMEVENPYPRYFDAAMRHIMADEQGIKIDPESGLPHLAHAVCCLLFMMHFEGP